MFADNSRYGTLVNKKELNGGQQLIQEGDLLQFGHKSIFRLGSSDITGIDHVPATRGGLPLQMFLQGL